MLFNDFIVLLFYMGFSGYLALEGSVQLYIYICPVSTIQMEEDIDSYFFTA